MRCPSVWKVLAVVALWTGCGPPLVSGPPKVPAEAIAHAVIRDPALLERAWSLPVAREYGRMLRWQRNGSLCGPATLLNLFASRGRMFADEAEVLAGSGKCLTGVCMMGLTLDEVAEVARLHTAASVTVLRDLTPAQFAEHVRQSNDPARRYAVNFTRKVIFGAGGGHHSPLGGYLEPEGLVFVLDVNRDFGPWLIERERLYAAMDTLDDTSQRKRGLLLVE